MPNTRFHGAWRLVSIDAKDSDGSALEPFGPGPVGIIAFDASGAFSVQVGARDGSAGTQVAFFGTLEAPGGGEGTLVLHPEGASVGRLLTDQPRHFRFISEDDLILTPPPRPDAAPGSGIAATMQLHWRRIRP